MSYNIIIISKASMGLRGMVYGLDRDINPFKSVSSKLKKTLKTVLADENIDVSVSVDNWTGDLKLLKKDGANLILISPYVEKAFQLDSETEKFTLKMTENEFLGINISRILQYIQNDKE